MSIVHHDFASNIFWKSCSAKIGYSNQTPQAFTVAAGSVILFDYRVLHRGLAHKGDQPRPVLYFTYGRRWFSDNLNFPERDPPRLVPYSTAAHDSVSMVKNDAKEPIPLDPEVVRAEFPALARADGVIYLDGPGGTQVHNDVIVAMTDALSFKMSNIGYDYGVFLIVLVSILCHNAKMTL